jgi:hypothetical protein
MSGHLRLTSSVPIHAWASKIDNGTNDSSLEVAFGDLPQETNVRLLVPSVSSTDQFKSALTLVNREAVVNQVLLTARDSDGRILGQLIINLPPQGSYRSPNILEAMGVSRGAYGPLTIESTNGGRLNAVSEVKSDHGTGGFLPAVSLSSATLSRLVPEVVDTDSLSGKGSTAAFRTNLGINNVAALPARVRIELWNESGQIIGNLQTTVPAGGLSQLNGIVRSILGHGSDTPSYVRIFSDQPIHSWASKINNETEDPSIVMSVP